MKSKRICAAAAALIITAGLFTGCGSNESSNTASTSSAASESVTSELAAEVADSAVSAETDNVITLGDEIKISGSGAAAANGVVTISQGGTYELSGTLSDGYINVTAKDEVTLILNGVDITNKSGACIYSNDAKTLTVSTKSGTENTLTDGSDYTDTDAKGAIFSNDDLVLNGEGKLTVNGSYKHAVASDDEIVIGNGEYVLNAAFDGVHANETITIQNASLSITAEGDGIESDLSGVSITGGSLDITTAGGEENAPTKRDNDFGGSWNDYDYEYSSEEDSTSPQSFKGIKAETAVSISGGKINIDSYDDAVHSNSAVTVTGGTLELLAGDDGIHGDDTLTISDGSISITGCYEGLEAGTIDISGGVIDIVASDDGLNAVENESSSEDDVSDRTMFGGGGMDEGYGTLIISGGTLTVDADGDGLDSNGTIEMSGGTAIVYGPTNDGNGALDYGDSCTVTGGTLIAGGASGMAQSAGSSSQSSLMLTFASNISSSDTVTVTDSSGSELASYQSSKTYNSLVICTDKMSSGDTVKILLNGSEVGEITLTDGVYSASVSSSGISESSGSDGMGMGGMGDMGGGRMGGMR